MRFRQNARLDPSQVQDVRGRGGLPGGGLAVGGGGLGVVGIVIYLLVTLLSNGSGGPLGGLDGATVAQQPPAVCSAPSAGPEPTRTPAKTAASSATSTASSATGPAC